MRGADDGRRAADAREASLKTVIEHLADVTEQSQHIVRDEIELAKAEVAQKVGSIGRGAAVGAAAGVFIALGGLFFLHGLSWFFAQEIFGADSIYWGYFLTAGLLFLLAAVGGLVAYKFVKKGAPPVPTMAIDEARLIRDSVQGTKPHPEPEHGPVRTLGSAADRPTGDASVVQTPATPVLTKPAQGTGATEASKAAPSAGPKESSDES